MVHTRKLKTTLVGFFSFSLLVVIGLGTAGCNVQTPGASPATPQSKTIQGRVFGGQQPVVGASIQLYAAGAPASGGGYGQGATALITGTLPTTDSNGNFTITGQYASPLATPSFFYIVSTGGSPGNDNPANPNIVLMAALSGCTPSTTLPSSLFIQINEVTTVAFVSALQPFMVAPTGNVGSPILIGAPANASTDLRNGFETAGALASIATGSVADPTSSNGQRINTLADILAYCVNSYSPSTNCSTLFTNATPSGATNPAADTAQAAWYIEQNPATNTAGLFGLIPASPPFVALSSAPANFSSSLPPTAGLACFVILGGSSITNTGPTIVSGANIGLYPGTSVSGFSFSAPAGTGTITPPATNYIDDAVAENAQADLAAAFTYTADLTGATTMAADMTGVTFTAGVYNNPAAVTLSAGQVTLDAQNNPNSIFVFQIGSTLGTAAGTQIVLANGAQATNVFWQVGSAATLGANSTFEGTLMAGTTITVGSGVTIQGRALAIAGAVNLASDTVTAP